MLRQFALQGHFQGQILYKQKLNGFFYQATHLIDFLQALKQSENMPIQACRWANGVWGGFQFPTINFVTRMRKAAPSVFKPHLQISHADPIKPVVCIEWIRAILASIEALASITRNVML